MTVRTKDAPRKMARVLTKTHFVYPIVFLCEFILGERACMPRAREYACFTHHRVSYVEHTVLAQ